MAAHVGRAGLLVALVVPAAGAGPLGAPAAARAGESGAPLCRLTDARIDEASGLAAAGGRWWTHEDSGAGDGRLYALDEGCRTVAVVGLPGPAPRDAEDLAVVGAGRDEPTLWLADTGDNRARRDGVVLHRVALPALPPSAGRGAAAPTVEAEGVAFRASYADGPRDAEALLVDPAGSLVVVTKPLLGRPGVYSPVAPLVAGSTAVLRRVGEVRLGAGTATAGRPPPGPAGPLSPLLVTGGAVAPDGGRLALTTYTAVHEWLVRPGEREPGGGVDLPGVLGRAPDRVVPLPPLEQAEAVAYAEDGRSLLVTGEGAGAPVHRLAGAEAPAGTPPSGTAPSGTASSGTASSGTAVSPGEAHGGGARPSLVAAAVAAVAAGLLAARGWSRRRPRGTHGSPGR